MSEKSINKPAASREAMRAFGAITMSSILAAGTAQAENLIWSDDFDAVETTDPANVFAAAVNPLEEWFQKDVDDIPASSGAQHWSTEDHNGSQNANSTRIGDVNLSEDSDFEMSLGFGYDEVRILIDTGITFDLTQDYTLSGSWENSNALDRELGFIAGIAEFDSSGNLVQTIGFDPEAVGGGTVAAGNVFGDSIDTDTDPEDPDSQTGDIGTFLITVTAAELATANVAAGNSIGLFFHSDDDGVLGSDFNGFAPNRADVYLVDNLRLMTAYQESVDDIDGDGLLDSFENVTEGFDRNDPDDLTEFDSDGDGQSDGDEEIFGTDPNLASSFFCPSIAMTSGTAVEVKIPASNVLEGRTYSLAYSVDLTSGSWGEIDSFSPTAGEVGLEHLFMPSLTSEAGFYRIEVSLSGD